MQLLTGPLVVENVFHDIRIPPERGLDTRYFARRPN